MNALIPSDAEKIIEVVAAHFGLTAKDLKGKRRTNQISQPRHIAFHLISKLCGGTHDQIGTHFKCAHGGVWHGLKRVRGTMSVDGVFAGVVNFLESRCKLILEAK